MRGTGNKEPGPTVWAGRDAIKPQPGLILLLYVRTLVYAFNKHFPCLATENFLYCTF